MAIIKDVKTGNFINVEDKRASGEGVWTTALTVMDLVKILISKGIIVEADIK